MKRLRKIDKQEILYNLFPKVGSKISVEDAMRLASISSLGSLKTNLSRFRKEGVLEVKTIDVSMKNGILLRVK